MYGWLKRQIEWPENLPSVVASLARTQPEFVWLDSSDADPGGGLQCSLLAWAPNRILAQSISETIVTDFARASVNNAGGLWNSLRLAANTVHEPSGFGLTPGWVGTIGFPVAALLERVPCRIDPLEPIARLGMFDQAILLEHGSERAFILTSTCREDCREAIDRAESAWQQACAAAVRPGVVHARIVGPNSRQNYETAVRRAVEYIAAGDIYQVNLAHRIALEIHGEVVDVFLALRASNPAAYGALLQTPDGAIASVSPELFLSVADGRVRTSPIKGTRPLTGDAAADAEAIRSLLSSAKDAAELAMIVDLHRNDIGRVCRPGGVRVVEPRRISCIPGIVHTVADIEGDLAPGMDALDALRAAFPAGSVSGVPKIRAIEIIHELEESPRGAYTGAIGVFGLDGSAQFNVAIRTVQMRARQAFLHVGAGIVADSDPANEYEETLAKGRRILSALGVADGLVVGRTPPRQWSVGSEF